MRSLKTDGGPRANSVKVLSLVPRTKILDMRATGSEHAMETLTPSFKVLQINVSVKLLVYFSAFESAHVPDSGLIAMNVTCSMEPCSALV